MVSLLSKTTKLGFTGKRCHTNCILQMKMALLHLPRYHKKKPRATAENHCLGILACKQTDGSLFQVSQFQILAGFMNYH